MKKITGKFALVALSIFATVPIILTAAHSKEMRMQESSYAPVMITKSFEAVREMDVEEKDEVMSKHMAMLNERHDLG